MTSSRGLGAGVLLLLLGGCTSEPMTIEEYPCPPGGTQLSYENFGSQFLDSWCQRCHDEGPNGIYFRNRDEVFHRKERIFINAAAVNTYMPPGPDDPSREERDLLAEWLACGAP